MNSNNAAKLSQGDIERRRAYLEQNITIFKSQGYEVTDTIISAMEKWVTGEMSDAEHLAFLEASFKSGSENNG